jgi:hypothetical protein
MGYPERRGAMHAVPKIRRANIPAVGLLFLALLACSEDSTSPADDGRRSSADASVPAAESSSGEEGASESEQEPRGETSASKTQASNSGSNSAPGSDSGAAEMGVQSKSDAVDTQSDADADRASSDTDAAADDSDDSNVDTGDADLEDPQTTPDDGSNPAVDDAGTTGSRSDDAGTDLPVAPEPEVELADAIAVVVGYGARRVRSEDGITWTDFQEIDPEGGDDNNLFRGVGYGDGTFVAVGGAGEGFTMISRDGRTWTDENRELRAFVSDTVFLDGVFVAAGGNGLRTRSLDGGKTWQDEADYYSGHFRAIAAGSGVAIAVGHTYGQEPDRGITTATSDGAVWTEVVAEGETLSSIAFGNATFVAMGAEGRCSTSADGVDWDTQTLEGADSDVLFAAGEFLIPSQRGYYRSTNGTDFVESSTDATRSLSGHFKDAYFHFGWPATIARSEDLESWDTVLDPGGSGLTQMAVGVPGE